MNRIKIIFSLLSVIIISALIYFTFYRTTHLTAGLKLKFDKVQILEKAHKLADNLNAPQNNLEPVAQLKSNNALIRQVQHEYGFNAGNRLLRKSIPGFYWQVAWVSTERTSLSFGNNPDNSERNASKITIEYDASGNLLRYKREINDSTKLPSISEAAAMDTVRNFIIRSAMIKELNNPPDSTEPSQYSNFVYLSNTGEQFHFKSKEKIELPHRIDYHFTWKGKSSYISDELTMEAVVSGNSISSFRINYITPESYSSDSSNVYQASIEFLFYFIIIILVAVLAYRKTKAYEIGFKTAFIITVAVVISAGLYIYSGLRNETGWAILIPLVMGSLFIGLGIFITWAVSETVTRETWKEKLISVDLLTKGYFTHSRVGESLLNGITLGIGLTSVWMILLVIVENFSGLWSSSYDSVLLSYLNSFSPSVNIIDKYFYVSFFMFAVFFNLVLSGLKKRFKSTTVLIVVSGIVWGLVISNDIRPYFIGVGLEIILGILFSLSYVKFDGLTTLAMLISYFSFSKCLSIFSLELPSFTQEGYFLLFILLIVILYSLYSLYSKDKQVDFNSITPVFALNITERQRLQRELEIARDVQMSFLPSKNPVVNGLEIASRCLPALEVGGDYYDFFDYDKNKLGIIIGDVSGKGTQAAFYMTLTKGFMKAVSKNFTAPAAFLKEMNTLFYENVERGTFISMVSGIFDLEKKKFYIARAGHNPVIVRNSSPENVETLNPAGLALGLEKGTVFNNTIKEIEMNISPGDVFVFYTDGFTEAMNKIKEEFGEERLMSIVKENSGMSSEELLDKIIKEVKTFMGKTPQHDDMTMVVVKVVL